MKRRLKRKWKNISKNHKLLFLSTISILIITVGYATLNNVLNIRGYASIDKGDGMIFTGINVKENNGATILEEAGIKAKTLIHTNMSFSEPGSITFTVDAQNQGDYDAKLIGIEGLERLNNQDPTCIQVSVNNHNINDVVYTGSEKIFDVTITSTCIEYSHKEIEIYFKYKKEESQGGVEPTPPGSGNSVEYLVNNIVKDDVASGGNGLVAIDDNGEITTSTTPREYRYIGSSPNNYVLFNNELWRIIGIFDGQLKIIRVDASEETMQWNNNGTNDWSESTLQAYLNGEYLNSIDSVSQGMISTYTWKLGAVSAQYGTLQAQLFYELERYNNPLEWQGKIALMYPSDYGFSTSGGTTMDRSSCLAQGLDNAYYFSEECVNNTWILGTDAASNSVWTLSSVEDSSYGVASLMDAEVKFVQVENTFAFLPTLYLKSRVEFNGGYGTEKEPYILNMTYTAVDYLIDNKLESDVAAGGNGLVALDNSGEITTSTTPREYRYIGSSPDNYVMFNNELWRIIGIFDGQLKIMRANKLESMKWNSNDTNDWSGATLQTYLNGEYLNSMDSVSQEMISTYTWKLGGSRTYNDVTAQMFYERERGVEVYEGRPTEWPGKIALIYPSDYGFSTSGGSTTNRSSCLAKELYNWNGYSVSDCANNSWISRLQWTLTPRVEYGFEVFAVANGCITYIGTDGWIQVEHDRYPQELSPTLYLKPNVERVSGSGKSGDPFILKYES